MTGTLYGIGAGPGDPELMTVKGANILSKVRHVFVPKARDAADSVALEIAQNYLKEDSIVHELVFPMTADKQVLAEKWDESAGRVAEVLKAGDDACFLTLGDALLYSTYIYLVRSLRARLPEANVVTIPGITAFSATAALANFPVGVGKDPVTIVPAVDDLDAVRRALATKGTVILMKIGKRLAAVLDLLEENGLIDRGVFVSRVGMADQRIEFDLRSLRGAGEETGYLSIILVHAGEEVAG